MVQEDILFKDFLSGALAALLSVEQNQLCNFERAHHGEHSYEVYDICTSGSGGVI